MFDRATAREIAGQTIPKGVRIDDEAVRELQQGWFFPYRCTDDAVAGTQGIVVNKTTGKLFSLGSAFPVERDLVLYDAGYQFERYDLVITRIANVERCLDTMEKLAISIVEPEVEHGRVWKIPRALTRKELRARLARLPCVFGNQALYFHADKLERARAEKTFQFEFSEFRSAEIH